MDVPHLPKRRNQRGHGTRGTRFPVRPANKITNRRTTSVAVYPREVALLKAVAAVVGRIPADVVRDALDQWIRAQDDLVRAVAEAAELRFEQESGA